MQGKSDLKTQLSTCISLQSDSGVSLITYLTGIVASLSNTGFGSSSSEGWLVGVQQGLVAADVSNHSVV